MKKFRFQRKAMKIYLPKDLGNGWWGVMNRETGELVAQAPLPKAWAIQRAKQLDRETKK